MSLLSEFQRRREWIVPRRDQKNPNGYVRLREAHFKNFLRHAARKGFRDFESLNQGTYRGYIAKLKNQGRANKTIDNHKRSLRYFCEKLDISIIINTGKKREIIQRERKKARNYTEEGKKARNYAKSGG